MNLRDTLNIEGNTLHIGGCNAVELAEKYGTPLYVMDESYIRRMCRTYIRALKRYGDAKVLFASKALSTKAIYKIVGEEGLGADVVSAGELHTALAGGMPASKIYFHGNNKTDQELEYAVKEDVHCVVVDNLGECVRLGAIAVKQGKRVKVLVRVNPGVEAHTHHYIQTARTDSKFGFGIASGEAMEAVLAVLEQPNLDFAGIDAHIGSQIFELKPYALAAEKLTEFAAEIKAQTGADVRELNMGGGFGVYYSEGDKKLTPEEYSVYIDTIIDALNENLAEKGLKRPTLVIEPGRSIVAEAGVTLYTVGAIKEIKGVKKYINVDGGMFDNPRFALYQAKYTAALANRMDEPPVETVTVAGKWCEREDMLVMYVLLPKANTGDILVVFTTGGYNYSMASTYNRNAVPPMVLCSNGKSDYMVKPQTLDDLMRNDVIPFSEEDK